jgi:hypothetical protein
MQKQALALGDAIETAVKLKDLDNRLNQPDDANTDITVTSTEQSDADAVEAKYEADFVAAVHTTADEGPRTIKVNSFWFSLVVINSPFALMNASISLTLSSYLSSNVSLIFLLPFFLF